MTGKEVNMKNTTHNPNIMTKNTNIMTKNAKMRKRMKKSKTNDLQENTGKR